MGRRVVGKGEACPYQFTLWPVCAHCFQGPILKMFGAMAAQNMERSAREINDIRDRQKFWLEYRRARMMGNFAVHIAQLHVAACPLNERRCVCSSRCACSISLLQSSCGNDLLRH